MVVTTPTIGGSAASVLVLTSGCFRVVNLGGGSVNSAFSMVLVAMETTVDGAVVVVVAVVVDVVVVSHLRKKSSFPKPPPPFL